MRCSSDSTRRYTTCPMSTRTAPSEASTSTQRSLPSLSFSRRLREDLFGQAQGQHLAALEPDGGATYGVGTQCASTGWTSSVRTPPAVAGCRNATCVPRMPVRGVSSISRSPASRAALQRGLHVLDLVGDVVQARPLPGQEAPDGRVLAQRGTATRRGFRRRRAARPRRPAPRSSRDAPAACRRSGCGARSPTPGQRPRRRCGRCGRTRQRVYPRALCGSPWWSIAPRVGASTRLRSWRRCAARRSRSSTAPSWRVSRP